MDAVTAKASAGIAYATASHATVFTSVALSFIGLGWALALMLRPRTCGPCVWSLALFSLAWLLESTTHLLGIGGHVGVEMLRYGVWIAVALFALGLLLGGIGVLAYIRNEHKYERGLTIGVLATLLNLWVVGGIVMAMRQGRMAELGRGMVVPMLPTGGPVDQEAILAELAKRPSHQPSESAQRMRAVLGRVFSHMAAALSDENGQSWELHSENGETGPGAALKGHACGSPEVLQALHGDAQFVFTRSGEPGWMSLDLGASPKSGDPAASLSGDAHEAMTRQLLAGSPPHCIRAARLHIAGFEVVRTSHQVRLKGLAGPVYLDRWTAAAGTIALRMHACAPEGSAEFDEATTTMVSRLLRNLRRDAAGAGLAPPESERLLDEAWRFERAAQYGDAIPLWRQAASVASPDPEAILGLLRCLWKTGKPKEALAFVDSAAAPRAESMAGRLAEARVRAGNGDAEARQVLIKEFAHGLADDDSLAALMVSYVAGGDRSAAVEHLAKYRDRHGAAVVAWWQAYLSPPAAASASTAPTTTAAVAAPTVTPGSAAPRPAAANTPPGRPSPARPNKPR